MASWTRLKARYDLGAMWFLLPNLAGFLIFTLLPVIASLALSFTEYHLVDPPTWRGLDNFTYLLTEGRPAGDVARNVMGRHDPRPEFLMSVYNTAFLFVGIPLGVFGSLFLALVLNQKFKGRVFFRTVFFLPTVCAGIAILILWRGVLADTGLLNQLLAQLGITGPNWLGSVTWAKPALIVLGIWTGVGGYNMLLYLAALSNVPPELYEAAEIDGAGSWRKFWAITWPMVSPTTFFIVVMSTIGTFEAGFEASAVLFEGGQPKGSTKFVSYYIFEKAFQHYQMGIASAAAWLLFLAIFVATLVNWRFGGRRVVY